jgi:vancomycin resistance protein YoaR
MYLGKMKLPINFGKQASVFDSFSPIKTETIPSIVLDIKLILEGTLSDLSEQVEIFSQDLVISKNENGKIIFNGTAKNGRMIDRDKLTAVLKRAFANGGGKIDLPIKEIKAKIDAPADLKSMGIQEIVAEGYSNFFGSPPNRIHNINVAMQAFDGLLVAPGEEFSFGENLGEVNEETGYKKELVIKEGKTIPDYGGGVCQVSSTLFRAAFFGGFPITDRKPHSYAVAYYARPLGFGLDATVYPPYVDLKFQNDTNQYILIQAYTEGYDAYFKFYGTRDERVVTWEGPYIENKTEPPADIITYTDQLTPGEKKKIDSAHEGFDATWYRTVAKTADEESKTEKFFSRYQAWPNKYMVGQEPAEENTE